MDCPTAYGVTGPGCMNNFEEWLKEAARIAMADEWQIDPTYHLWRRWFELGLSPAVAVESLYELIRAGDNA